MSLRMMKGQESETAISSSSKAWMVGAGALAITCRSQSLASLIDTVTGTL